MLITSKFKKMLLNATYIRGYGDFDGQQTLQRLGYNSNSHPLAQLIGREAPPLIDGRIKRRCFEKSMELVIKKSVTASIF